MIRINLASPSATAALARQLAALALAGDVVTLAGDLGSGKTTFAGAFLRARGWGGPVPSPTLTLAQIYDTLAPPVWHLDCDRMQSADEVFDTGWDDARATGILLIEWPDRITALLPPDRLEIHITHHADARVATLTGYGSWHHRLQHLHTTPLPDANAPNMNTRS